MEKKQIKFNALDIVILVVVVLCILSLAVRLMTPPKTVDGQDPIEMGKYRMNFMVTDIAETSKDAFVPDDNVYGLGNGTYIGKLESIDTVSPSYKYLDNGKGEMEKVYYPDGTRIDLTGTIIAEGIINDDGFYASGTFFLSPGRTLNIYTGHIQVSILITSITEYES